MAKFPAALLTGPRQCGKTTLARQMAGTYLDMERSGDRVRLDAEWERLAGGSGLLVIDEAQHEPALFSRLRSAIDGDRRPNP